jgi:hypothetical protein
MALRHDQLKKVRAMVEVAIKGLGGDPAKAATGPDAWLVARHSAEVVVRLVQPDPEKSAYLQILSPVMRVPPNAAFKDRLLALNHEMGGLATFCVTPQGEVHLLSARSTEGVSAPEIARVIAEVAHFSDLYDDRLLDEFGREHGLRPEQRAKRKS